MNPGSTIHNQVDGLVAQPQAARDGGLTLSVAGPRFNAAGYLSGEFFGVVPSQDRVSDVSLMGSPAQIIGGVMTSIKILVMDIWKAIGVWNKGCRNETGNKNRLLPPILAENEVSVPTLILGSRKNAATLEAAHSSKVGHFVKSFVAKDRLPLFKCIHAGMFIPCCPMMQARG